RERLPDRLSAADRQGDVAPGVPTGPGRNLLDAPRRWPGVAVLVDQGIVAPEVLGLGPDLVPGAEPVLAEGLAQLVVGREPPEPGDEGVGRVEDQAPLALVHQLGQGAEVA